MPTSDPPPDYDPDHNDSLDTPIYDEPDDGVPGYDDENYVTEYEWRNVPDEEEEEQGEQYPEGEYERVHDVAVNLRRMHEGEEEDAADMLDFDLEEQEGEGEGYKYEYEHVDDDE